MDVKKTQSKAFANLVISLLLLAFEIWAYTQTLAIKAAKNAAVQPSVFPQIMIIGMGVFTVVLLVQSVIKLAKLKPDDPLAARAETINFIKDKGVLAALFVILLCAAYVYFFKDLGYVVVSILLSAVLMWLIGTRKPLQLALIAILVPLVMWLIFYKLLSVNIPMGILQFLRDAVDTIKL